MDTRPMLTAESTDWTSSFDSTPYPVGVRSSLATISSKFSFSPDPREWGSAVAAGTADLPDSDDEFYIPEKGYSSTGASRSRRNICRSISLRGAGNTGCLLLIIGGMLALFIGYPVVTFYDDKPKLGNNGGYNVGGINSTGQIPVLAGNFGLIDRDTPREAYTTLSLLDGRQMQLVFSDEFNVDGRSFYPGDDPYWEAVDLHYWATNNMEWYDPEAVTTQDGAMVISLSQKETHDLQFQGGLVTTWNKFCFTGGYVETSVQLPGANNVVGLWPAIWAMGNLGRAGYGATLEGVWPYSYDACDVGTVANQTIKGLPLAATVNGDQSKDGALSYLPGQRLSRCTCPGESHPGPKHADGTFVGRSAPEIDILEAQVEQDTLVAQVSQSAQWAPFNAGYLWNNSTSNFAISNPSISEMNSYVGGATQQATSVVTSTDPRCYELSSGCFSIYGFDYKPGFSDAYIAWISNNQVAWTLRADGMGADSRVQISARPVAQEPMYLIMNLGMSRNFGPVDLQHLTFPAHMKIDYIRVYQPSGAINVGCSPKDFPTEEYINQYLEAYTNPNVTTWIDDYHQTWPKNSLVDTC